MAGLFSASRLVFKLLNLIQVQQHSRYETSAFHSLKKGIKWKRFLFIFM